MNCRFFFCSIASLYKLLFDFFFLARNKIVTKLKGSFLTLIEITAMNTLHLITLFALITILKLIR
jgi:hypothetical protein